MLNKTFVSTIVLTLFLSCNSASENQEKLSTLENHHQEDNLLIEPQQDTKVENYLQNGISLTEIKTKQYTETSLSLKSQPYKEGINKLNFNVENNEDFNLVTIQNNFTIQKHSSFSIEQEFLAGNNVFLAFLTDKNRLSIKKNNTTVLENIVLFDEPIFNTKTPHLFYYLPQNNQPILDFCLINTSLAENGNQLEVTINGTVFYIKKWASYQIEGLNQKENTIRLRLLDKNKVLIDGPFNDSGLRTFEI